MFTRLRRLLQKLAMSSAMVVPETVLLQKDSKASFSALWKSELLWKHSTTYCTQTHTESDRSQLSAAPPETAPQIRNPAISKGT